MEVAVSRINGKPTPPDETKIDVVMPVPAVEKTPAGATAGCDTPGPWGLPRPDHRRRTPRRLHSRPPTRVRVPSAVRHATPTQIPSRTPPVS